MSYQLYFEKVLLPFLPAAPKENTRLVIPSGWRGRHRNARENTTQCRRKQVVDARFSPRKVAPAVNNTMRKRGSLSACKKRGYRYSRREHNDFKSVLIFVLSRDSNSITISTLPPPFSTGFPSSSPAGAPSHSRPLPPMPPLTAPSPAFTKRPRNPLFRQLNLHPKTHTSPINVLHFVVTFRAGWGRGGRGHLRASIFSPFHEPMRYLV